MSNTKKVPIVTFNASVVLSGMYSPSGGSAKLLEWTKKRKIQGIISETIKDEVLRRSYKLDIELQEAENICDEIFKKEVSSPSLSSIKKFEKIVSDYGDTHVLATAKETKSDYLVSLDKKHILSLKEKVKWVKVVSPGELIQNLVKYI